MKFEMSVDNLRLDFATRQNQCNVFSKNCVDCSERKSNFDAVKKIFASQKFYVTENKLDSLEIVVLDMAVGGIDQTQIQAIKEIGFEIAGVDVERVINNYQTIFLQTTITLQKIQSTLVDVFCCECDRQIFSKDDLADCDEAFHRRCYEKVFGACNTQL